MPMAQIVHASYPSLGCEFQKGVSRSAICFPSKQISAEPITPTTLGVPRSSIEEGSRANKTMPALLDQT